MDQDSKSEIKKTESRNKPAINSKSILARLLNPFQLSAFSFQLFGRSNQPITISAPGSLMLAGEHAVLHGHHAVVAAVDQRVTATLTPRNDGTITIDSTLGQRNMSVDSIDATPPFQFIGEILRQHCKQIPVGCDLKITSDFPADVGLGSSSAVTVATLGAIKTWIEDAMPSNESLLKDAVSLVRKVQGSGSGSDVAASIYGGALLYQATPKVITRFDKLPDIALIYAGYKTPTPEVISIVEKQRQKSADKFESLFTRMDACALTVAKAFESEDWQMLGAALSIGQLMLEDLGVCDETLAEIVSLLNGSKSIMGAKISGSGLGDCVLGIGTLDIEDCPYRQIPVKLSPVGVRQETP